MGKKDLLKAKRARGLINMADVIQNEIRNEGKTVDIRTLIKKGRILREQNEKLSREIRIPDGRIRNMTLRKGGD